jgi:hypothetical protein
MDNHNIAMAIFLIIALCIFAFGWAWWGAWRVIGNHRKFKEAQKEALKRKDK